MKGQIYKSLALVTLVMGLLFLPCVGHAQSSDTSTVSITTSSKILGIDTSTIFTALESATKNALSSWQSIVINQNGTSGYRTAYNLYETQPFVSNELLTFAAGVETNWSTAAGIHAGLNLFPKNGTLETQYHVNAKLAGYVEGDSASSNILNGGILLAGRVNIDSVFNSSAKTAKVNITQTKTAQINKTVPDSVFKVTESDVAEIDPSLGS